MTQQEILENNKLIAEFLGLTITTDGISLFDTNYKPLAKYHESWNDLMPVVEKIQSTWRNEDIFVVTIKSKHCLITLEKFLYKPLDIAYSSVKMNEPLINAVWHAVIEFIKWYNEECTE